MLPLREDNLPSHVSTLQWIGVPFILLLTVNFACVLYAVSRPSPSAPLAAETLATAPPDAAASTDLGEGVSDMPADAEGPGHAESLAHGTSSHRWTEVDLNHAGEGSSRVRVMVAPLPDNQQDEPSNMQLASARRQQWIASWRQRQNDWKSGLAVVEIPALDSIDDSVMEQPAQAATAPPSLDFPSRPAAIQTVDEAEEPRNTEAEENHLVVCNPDSNSAAVSFLVNDEAFTLQPGETQMFDGSDNHSIVFHRGGTFGIHAQSVKAGNFEFTASSSLGWQLKRRD